MGGIGRATDNIRIERFFRSFKWERLYLLPETVREVKEMTTEYMSHYNLERGHQGLVYPTPYEIYYNSNTLAA